MYLLSIGTCREYFIQIKLQRFEIQNKFAKFYVYAQTKPRVGTTTKHARASLARASFSLKDKSVCAYSTTYLLILTIGMYH